MDFIPVDTDNADEAVRILAAAFADDAVMNWTCNYPDNLLSFFRITLAPLIPHGLTYLDPQGRGAASWLGPGQSLEWNYSLANLGDILRECGLRGAWRLARSGAITEKHHPQQPHYYLFAIGALDEYRGQGVGSSLIGKMLRRCDDEGMPAYLENSKEENLRFYEGHGFRVQKEVRFARTAPPLWLMWREPVQH